MSMRDYLTPATRAWARSHEAKDDDRHDKDDVTHRELTETLKTLNTTLVAIGPVVANYDQNKQALADVLDDRKFWTTLRKKLAAGTLLVCAILAVFGWPQIRAWVWPDVGGTSVVQPEARGGSNAPATAIIHPQKGK